MDIQNQTDFSYLYNIGGAHGVRNIMGFSDFQKELLKAAEFANKDVIIGWTNSSQGVARAHLEKMGFTNIDLGSGRMMSHFIERSKLFSKEALEAKKKAEEERLSKLAARPRNKDGRLLNKDGTIKRKAYEYFVGDRISFQQGWENPKEGTIRSVSGTGINTVVKTRLHTLPVDNYQINLIKRIV